MMKTSDINASHTGDQNSARRLTAKYTSRVAAAIVVLFTAFACACSPRQNAAPKDGSTELAETPAKASGELNRCALLTDGEVRNAIGPHQPGTSDLQSEWGTQSCRWAATTAQKVEDYPNGWYESVEVAVFDKDKESWAREQARGEPVKDFVAGSQYDEMSGDLWFNCGRDRFCVVKAATNSPDNREQIARRLAQLVLSRVR
jgi:hypothetical protein